MGPVLPASYEDFLSVARNYRYDLDAFGDKDLFRPWVSVSNLNSRAAPAVFLTDLTQRKYVFMHKKISQVAGYQSSQLMAGGLDFYFSLMDESEFDLYNSKIFPEYIRFLKEIPGNRFRNYIFSRNNRVHTRDGRVINVLQRFFFIPDPKSGMPVALSGMVFDITHFRNDSAIIQTIEEDDSMNGEFDRKLVFKKVYYLDDEESVLTRREIEILKWIASGLNSKEISCRLNISLHTVLTHRKNMMDKTNSNNVAELVNFGIRSRLI